MRYSISLAIWVLMLLGIGLSSRLQGQENEVSSATTSSGIIDFQKHIAPIWKARCGECHIGDNAKEDFDVTDRDAMLALIQPGDAVNSELWTEYLMADPNAKNSLIMPPVAQGGRMPAEELALIRVWIEEGAHWPETLPDAAAEGVAAAPVSDAGLAMRFWHFQGYFHPAVVHLPLGLILMAGLSLVLSWVKWPRAEEFALYCMGFGAIFGFVAIAAGWSYADEKGYQAWSTTLAESRNPTLFWHRWLGVSVPIVGLFLTLVAWRARASKNRNMGFFWKVGLLALTLLVAWVGHQGGELTYGEELYEQAFKRLLGR